jgi:hypothetical protein
VSFVLIAIVTNSILFLDLTEFDRAFACFLLVDNFCYRSFH